MSKPSATTLREALLVAAPSTQTHPRAPSRWAYAPWGLLAVSVFLLYHVAVLLVWNSPNIGLTKPFRKGFLEAVNGITYFSGTHNTQSWEMFAPNPNRTNTFVRVYVEDMDGQLWDFEQDIWEQDRYPYIWYSRAGKVNRRIDGKKHFQRIYGGWICREWERQHGGDAARRVTFVRLSTVVPSPREVIDNGGWNQWDAPLTQTEQETVSCKTTVHAQLPNELRERYGLPLVEDERVFKPLKQRTWWDEHGQELERDEPGADESPDQ